MNSSYPTEFETLTTWATEAGFPQEEARRRYAQYLVLTSITVVAPLRETLVFKGGNALDFIWSPNRSTLDLDFSIDHTVQTYESTAQSLEQLLTTGLSVTGQRHNAHLAVNSIQPKTIPSHHTFITFLANIGYALPSDSSLKQRVARGLKSPRTIPIEISINEPICAATTVSLGDPSQPLRISTLDDIVAEKLRALLQQPSRNRNRRQDVLDLALILRNHPELDPQPIATYLIAKATARNILVTKSAFHHPEIAERAAKDYEQLRTTARTTFIEFEDAFSAILAFTDSFPIPT
jgi:predicted nucleotidyltransferase component of viral defense system